MQRWPTQINMKKKSKMSENKLPIWEVFIQPKVGAPFQHAGNVHASDKEMALHIARDLYTRRQEGTCIWAV